MKWLLALSLICLHLGSCISKNIEFHSFALEIFRLTNIERVDRGLRPFVLDPGLTKVAQIHSKNMAVDNWYNHVDRKGRNVSERQQEYYPEMLLLGIGENIYYYKDKLHGYTPQKLVQGWMNSPGHRANILDERSTHIGIGVYLKEDKLYATQVFANPLLKRLTKLPSSHRLNSTFTIDFEFLSPLPAEGFSFMLTLPDEKTQVILPDATYYEGVAPISAVWEDDTHLSVTLEFKYGKGIYTLQAGWGGTFYPDLLSFKVN